MSLHLQEEKMYISQRQKTGHLYSQSTIEEVLGFFGKMTYLK